MGSNFIQERTQQDNGNSSLGGEPPKVEQRNPYGQNGSTGQSLLKQTEQTSKGHAAKNASMPPVGLIIAVVLITLGLGVAFAGSNGAFSFAASAGEEDGDGEAGDEDVIYYHLTDKLDGGVNVIVLESGFLKLYLSRSVLSQVVCRFDEDDTFTVDWEVEDGWYRCSTAIHYEDGSETTATGYILFDELALSKVGVIDY